jgi:acylglycerol lipase
MKHIANTLTTPDGQKLHIQSWYPTYTPLAKIIITHGYAEHGGRYANTAEMLVQQGYAVYAWDLRGHGQSSGIRCFIEDFAEYLADLRLAVDYTHDGDEVPLFLLGHSLGGTISTLFAIQHPEIAFQGLILSAPFLQQVGRSDSPGFLRLLDILRRLSSTIPTFKLDTSKLSRDRSVVTAYEQDPLVFHGRCPVSTVAAIFRAFLQIRQGCHHIQLPLLILHGSADELADPAGSSWLIEGVGSINKTRIIYPDHYHELFHEPDKQLVWADLIAWLLSMSSNNPQLS